MARPITVTVGPLVTADDDGVLLSQKAAGAQYLVINGAKATGTFSASSVCASQSPGGAGALTIDGTLGQTNPVAGAGGTASAPSAYVQFTTPTRIYITSAGNDSGVTFTVTGTYQSVTGFGPGIYISETVTGANASVVATSALFSRVTGVSINGASAAAVTVGHSGTATLDVARRIIFTSGGDDSDITFTLSGTDRNGDPISEVVTGSNSTIATSVLSYSTVTSILTSAAVQTTIIVGTNGVADSQWVRFDNLASNAQVALQCTVSGTANYTVQQTLEDPNIITNQLPTPTYQWSPSSVAWVNHPDAALVAASTTQQGNYGYVPVWAKVVLNSGTGSVTSTFVQAYLS